MFVCAVAKISINYLYDAKNSVFYVDVWCLRCKLSSHEENVKIPHPMWPPTYASWNINILFRWVFKFPVMGTSDNVICLSISVEYHST